MILHIDLHILFVGDHRFIAAGIVVVHFLRRRVVPDETSLGIKFNLHFLQFVSLRISVLVEHVSNTFDAAQSEAKNISVGFTVYGLGAKIANFGLVDHIVEFDKLITCHAKLFVEISDLVDCLSRRFPVNNGILKIHVEDQMF